MRREITDRDYEDYRRTLMLCHAAIAAVIKNHPDDWKEKIRQAIPDEFEQDGAGTVDDYLLSFQKVEDRLV